MADIQLIRCKNQQKMSQNRQYIILYKEIEVKESTAVSEFSLVEADKLEMWANAQRDGRPAEHRWRPLFNAAKFG